MNLPLHRAPFPASMAVEVDPARFASPHLVALNEALATELGFSPDWLRSPEGVALLSGQTHIKGVPAMAQAYAGHQFGQFVPQLGDGRAHLLGIVTDHAGQVHDMQLKGSGPTPFSRRGDGLAALGPVLREYLVSEAMAALGVPTTRALAAVTTGETVWRDRPQPGAVLTRIASSHLRVGTFQYFAAREDRESLEFLCALAIERHVPSAHDCENPIRALYESVVARQARLIAHWMSLGFVHGVMNTDNMTLSGETIDYGPCAFLDIYRHDKVFSSIDHNGRYAYVNQPRLAGWNLARLAETLLPFFDPDENRALTWAQEALGRFQDLYQEAWLARMRPKLGLTASETQDKALIETLLQIMEKDRMDWTLSFRRLARNDSLVEPTSSEALLDWMMEWQARRDREPVPAERQYALMRQSNPAVIARNHRVAEAITSAENGDFTVFENLLQRLRHPFADDSTYEMPPLPEQIVHATFCGT
ncbi:protein adenylyltransferase SelO [Asaia prunellae]|uniref:protein adenylyltransferase SelO n=1 Tax=Asaia prunellae TaxID=610245 RepID=UPI0005511A37|nr:YdiU family protein [Asaia prunellae]